MRLKYRMMKRVFLLLLLSLACYQLHAQMGGYFSTGKAGKHVFPCREYEYIYVYYYDFNTLKSKEAILYTNVMLGEQENNIIMGDNIRNYVKPREGGGLEKTGPYRDINLENLIICNHNTPSCELERQYQYKFLYNGIWYYFNCGLELFPQPKKKNFIEKFKELLFK